MTQHDERSPASGARRPNRTVALTALGVVGLCLVGGMVVFGLLNRNSASGPRPAPTEVLAIPVSVGEARHQQSFDLAEGFSGLVVAKRRTVLGFDRAGRIEVILVDIGTRVERGALLVRLDTRAINAQVRAAQAQVEEAEAGLALAEATVRRQQQLFAQGFVSSQRLDEARAQVDAARARVAALAAQAATLEVEADLMRMTAPYSGSIVARFADEGQIAQPGAPVLELAEDAAPEVHIGVPQPVAAQLEQGRIYELAGPDGPFQAKLRAVNAVIDADKRTMVAVFDTQQTTSVPVGSVVRYTHQAQVQERGFWVPLSALSEADRGLWSIYVVTREANGRDILQKRQVEVVQSDVTRAFVRGPIEDGARFVSGGVQRLSPGLAVVPQPVAGIDVRAGE